MTGNFARLDMRFVHLEHALGFVLREVKRGGRQVCSAGVCFGECANLHSGASHYAHAIQPLTAIDQLRPPIPYPDTYCPGSSAGVAMSTG